MTYELIRSLPLPADTTKMILDYVGKTNTANIIHKYFTYPLSRLDFCEWRFRQYEYSVFGFNNGTYLSDLIISDFSGFDVIEGQSVHNLTIDNFFGNKTIISIQDWTNTIHRNYESYADYCDRFSIHMSLDLYWTGIAEYSYLDTTLFQ